MEEDDDNWSYSFPPSTEDLHSSSSVVQSANAPGQQGKEINGDHHSLYQYQPPNDRAGFDVKVEGNPSAVVKSADFVHMRKVEDMSRYHVKSETPHTSAHNHDIPMDETPLPETTPQYSLLYLRSQIFGSEQGNGLQQIKSQSLALQPAFMLKLAPADPQTTRKDANLIISKENASNALALNGDSPTSTSNSPALRSDFKNSIRIWQQKTQDGDQVLNCEDQTSDSEALESMSPKIITYRKTTHVRKTSNTLKLGDQEDKFDPKLYVNEKYRNSCYRYATIKRNVDFHQLFKSIDLTDRLLDDFACALSREILLQGRIYITENCLCFNSNLLGWVTSLVVPFSEIIRIDKKSTAGLFPNGIIVETKTSKHNFASFLSRDATYDFMRVVWLGATGKEIADLDSHPGESFDVDATNSSERRISNYIMSIDEGDNIDVKWNDDHFEDSEEEISDTNTNSINNIETETRMLSSNFEVARVKTLKPNSAYKNRGPDFHLPTIISRSFDGSSEEIEVLSEVIEGPLGAVFEILFGRENPTFHKAILKDQGATEISDYGAFESLQSEPSKLERSFNYQRPLGYSIGPKSTKCCVKEIIEYHNLEESIVVLSITDTPDVPSGGSFSVMTRFYLHWCADNLTQIRIAYRIKWIGRSWIKGMVEKLTLSAQTSVSKMLINRLKAEVNEQMYLPDLPPALPQTEEIKPHLETPLKIVDSELENSTENLKSDSDRPFTSFNLLPCLMLAFFVLFIYSHLTIVAQILDLRALLIKQQKVLEIFLGEFDSIWRSQKDKEFDSADVENLIHLLRLLKQPSA